MKRELDHKLHLRNIKPTAMRQLVLHVLTEQSTAISLPEIPIPDITLPAKFSFENVNMVVKGVCANCRRYPVPRFRFIAEPCDCGHCHEL